MTIRITTCKELAEDKTAVQNMIQCYADIDRGASPIAVMFPWFPSAARKAKETGTMGLYTLLTRFVEQRRSSRIPSTDPIEVLLGQGLSTDSIVGVKKSISRPYYFFLTPSLFLDAHLDHTRWGHKYRCQRYECILHSFFSFLSNHSHLACWSLLYLAENPVWRARVSKEFKALLHKHTDSSSSEPLNKRLAMIPLSAWEEELPSAELVIRETIRLLLNLGIPRRNTHRSVAIDGVTIEKGDFVMYSAAQVHLNPDIYPNPTTFDPERYAPGREEDKKEGLAYLGWGAGELLGDSDNLPY